MWCQRQSTAQRTEPGTGIGCCLDGWIKFPLSPLALLMLVSFSGRLSWRGDCPALRGMLSAAPVWGRRAFVFLTPFRLLQWNALDWGLEQQTRVSHRSGGGESEIRVPAPGCLVRTRFLICRQPPARSVLTRLRAGSWTIPLPWHSPIVEVHPHGLG